MKECYDEDDSRVETITASGVLYPDPVRVLNIHLTNPTEAGVCDVYDNGSATGTPIISLRCAINGSDSFVPCGRLHVKRSLYINLTGGHEIVTIETQSYPKMEKPV